MDDLVILRQKINKIDEEMLKLFIKRMKVVKEVAEYKIKNSMKVIDLEREKQIMEAQLRNIEAEELKVEAKKFIQSLINISRETQEYIISKE